MISYIIRRFFQAVVVVFGVILIVFGLFHLESTTVIAKAIIGPRASAAQVQSVIRQLGLNRPLYYQVWRLIDNYAHFDFGTSYQFNSPVRALILAALPKTLLLVGTSTAFALLVAIPLGVFQTVRRNKPSDYALTSMAFIFYATPPFVLGPLLVLFLAVDHHVFLPYVPPGDSIGQLATDWHAMVLPVFTLAAVTIAAFSRYMRSSMMDAMTQDYVRTARAKGASRSRVLFRHAFRNALIPIITLLGLSIPAIVSGAVITETVFNYPGMGFLTTRAAEQFDLGTVVGTTVVASIATVLGSLVADILYAVADPRIRYVRG
ncbi:MAG: ABC transporter permease [Acidimicrobiales bacterium]